MPAINGPGTYVYPPLEGGSKREAFRGGVRLRAPSPTGYLQAGNGRAAICKVLFALIVSAALGEAALAANDPLAACPSKMAEADYLRAGGKLTIVSPAHLKTFPSGFVNRFCSGNVAMDAVVQPDGAVALSGKDHGVVCVSDLANADSVFRSAAWHDYVITRRFLSLRFAPPRLAGRTVCVTIERGWIPEAPHRLFSPEEWRKWSKRK